MKRGRENGDAQSLFDTANSLMLLSKPGETNLRTRKLFKCKTCNKEFSSFQGLGGHRASHKKKKPKPKPMMMGLGLSHRPRLHECHICGVEFVIGQALGGHMRKHRAKAINDGLASHHIIAVPVLDESIWGEGIDLMPLDLNLTPLENDLKLGLRPDLVNCLI